MERKDLRTLDQKRAYDLIYGKGKKPRRQFFRPDLDEEDGSSYDPSAVQTPEENREQKKQDTGIWWGKGQGEEEKQSAAESSEVKGTSLEQRADAGLKENRPSYQRRRVPEISIPNPGPELVRAQAIADRVSAHEIDTYFRAPEFLPKLRRFVSIEGEYNLGLPLIYAAAGKLCWGIEGLPGSSKTLHMNKVLPLLTNKYIISQMTESVLFEDCERINQHDDLILTEWQKAMIGQKEGKDGGRILEILNDIAEGREAELKKRRGNGIDIKTLNPIPFGYTRAETNSWKPNDEFRRRVVTLYTIKTKDDTERSNASIVESRQKVHEDLELRDDIRDRLTNYIDHIRSMEDVFVFDPYSECILDIVPPTVYSTCHLPHYGNMIDSSARFNFYDRLHFTAGKFTYVVADLEDHIAVYQTYHPSFIKTLEKLVDGKEEAGLLEGLKKPDWGEWFARGCDFLEGHENAEVVRKGFPGLVDRHKERQLQDDYVMWHNFLTGEKEAVGEYHV